jgi:hypothetical protein
MRLAAAGRGDVRNVARENLAESVNCHSNHKFT